MVVRYRKLIKARTDYRIHTGPRPASWEVLVDGVVRGDIRGYNCLYSRERHFVVTLDGRRVRERAHSLGDAKELVEVWAAGNVPAWFFVRDLTNATVGVV